MALGMAMGDILAQLREEKDVGQKEIAAYLNVSIGTVSNYENNVHSPDLVTLCRLGRTSYRDDPSILNRRVSRDYTVTDIINTVLSCDSGTVDHLMEYAEFLKAKRQK